MTQEIVNGRICVQNNCHHCCIETEMLLTKRDIHRIVAKTSIPAKKFVIINEDGNRMLANRQSNNRLQCFFLDSNGLCSIYEIRPEGCQFYPIIWDLTEHQAIIDDYCPHRIAFGDFLPNISKKLENFIFRVFGRL